MAFTKTIADFDDVELAPGGSALVDPSGINITTGFAAQFSAGSGFDITGNTGPINILTKEMGSAYIFFDASGTAGNFSVESQRGGETYVSGSAYSFGDISLRSLKDGSGSADAELYATSGGVGNIDLFNSSIDGSAEVNVYASGDVGNIFLKNTAAKGQVSAGVSAYGGSVGDIYVENKSPSGSARVNVSAYAQLEGGSAAGGNVGDIEVVNRGPSGDVEVYAYAFGVTSGGVYEGGGNIGNINIRSKGGASAESDVYAYAYSGGSVGTTTIKQKLEKGDYSASASVDIYAYGLADRIATIGDVVINTKGDRGSDNSGEVDLYAYSGADIGNISISHNDKKGNSGDNDVYANAYANGLGGGNIGNIYLTNNTFNGQNNANLHADTSIGNITMVNKGGGSGDNYLTISGSANVGDIALSFGKKHVFDGGGAYFYMESGASGGNIGDFTVTGGTKASTYNISGSAGSFASVNFSQFNGSADIDLDGVTLGTTIHGSRNGSYIDGTQGTDGIYLNSADADDTVELEGNTVEDNVFGFQLNGDLAGGDVLDVRGMNNFSEFTSNPVGVTVVGDGDVIKLVDIAGGEDITTEAGLLAALETGEYANINAAGFNVTTFITAASSASTTFYVFEAVEDTNSLAGFDSVNLIGVVNADGAFSQFDSTNLI